MSWDPISAIGVGFVEAVIEGDTSALDAVADGIDYVVTGLGMKDEPKQAGPLGVPQTIGTEGYPPQSKVMDVDADAPPSEAHSLWAEVLRHHYPEAVARAFGERFNGANADADIARARQRGDDDSVDFLNVMRAFPKSWPPSGVHDLTDQEVRQIAWAVYLDLYTSFRQRPHPTVAGAWQWVQWDKNAPDPDDPRKTGAHVPVDPPQPTPFYSEAVAALLARRDSVPRTYPTKGTLPGISPHPRAPSGYMPGTKGRDEKLGLMPGEVAMLEVLRPYFPHTVASALLQPSNDDERTRELQSMDPNTRELLMVLTQIQATALLKGSPPTNRPVPWKLSTPASPGGIDYTEAGWDSLKQDVTDRMVSYGTFPSDFETLWRQALERAKRAADDPTYTPGATTPTTAGGGGLLLLLLLFALTKRK